MRYDADIIVLDSDDNPIMLVEVQGKRKATVGWAVELRRSLLDHNNVPGPRYFLLALPDRFYLWDDSSQGNLDLPPRYEVDSGPVIAPYLRPGRLTMESVGGTILKMVVDSWLDKLMMAAEVPEQLPTDQRWVIDSGLLGAMRGGRIERPTRV